LEVVHHLSAGQQLLIGIQEKFLTQDLKLFLREILPSGIIFFSRNIESIEKFKKFVLDLRELLGEEVFFAIDHEGGLVQRLSEVDFVNQKSSITPFPGNRALGKSGREDWAYQQGKVMAAELGSLGIQVNLAPVVDVLTEQFNPGITIRSFGDDPLLVSRLAQVSIRGMQDHGLAATAKHFPGKGAATVDAHEDLPFVSCSQEEMEKVHLEPFRNAIKTGVSFIMTSHVVYRNLDASFPATFSKKIVQELLREKLSFNNVILSDDLEMGAIVKKFSFEESVIRSVEAGHDFVLICHQPDLIRRGYRALESAYQTGRLDYQHLEKSISRLKDTLKKVVSKKAIILDKEGWILSCEIAEASVELVQRGHFLSTNNMKKKERTIFIPDFFELSDRFYFEKVLLDEESFFLKSFKNRGYSVKEYRFSLKKDFDVENFGDVSPDSSVVLFCFDAKNFQAQRDILLEAQKRFNPCAVILLRNPYDREYVKEGTTFIQTYGFRTPQIQRAIEILCEMEGV